MVDIGISAKKIKEKLNKIDIDTSEINAILLTHEHSDHIKGIKMFSKNINCNIYATKETFDSIDFEYKNKKKIEYEHSYIFENVRVNVLKTSHDSLSSIGFLFEYENKKFAHITDTGYISNNVLAKTRDCYFYLIESNYEDEVLMINTKYPFNIKKRILSDVGHLSNIQCNEYLCDVVSKKTKYILFAHLSENNNDCILVEQIHKNIEVNNKYILKKDENVRVDL